MRLDLKKYSINRSFIQQEYAKDRSKDIRTVISTIGAGIHCPLLALCFYLAESEGFTPELVDMINCLVRFYGYKEISGQPANSPFLHLS